MPKPALRPPVLATALLALAWWAAAPTVAQDTGPGVRTGDFDGLWHGAKVKFSIQQVHPNNTFDGIAEFANGRYAGLKFGIHGRLDKDGSLVATRYVAGDTQVARVGPPRLVDGQFVWQGETTGVGLPDGASWPFELRIPRP